MATIHETLQQILGIIDYKWFSEIRKLFINDAGYDTHSKKIKFEFEDYFYGSDSENQGGYYDTLKIEKTIEEFAWNRNFDESDFGDKFAIPPFPGRVISSRLLKVVDDYVPVISDVHKQDDFITKILTVIFAKLKEDKELYETPEYTTTVDYIYDQFKKELSAKYGYIKRLATKAKNVDAFLTIETTPSSEEYESDEEQIRNDFLKPLSGEKDGVRIMSPEDFEKVIRYTIDFIDGGGVVPENMVPIKTNHVKGEFIRYLFYKLYDSRRQSRVNKINQENWALLIQPMFKEFENTDPDTIRRKFKNKPGDYDSIIKKSIKYR